MSKKKRKTWSVQEKLRIVLAGVQGDIETIVHHLFCKTRRCCQ